MPFDPNDPLANTTMLLGVHVHQEEESIIVQLNPCIDVGAWGVVLSDLVGHIANAYARQGMDPTAVRDEVLRMFAAEQKDPTGRPEAVRGN